MTDEQKALVEGQVVLIITSFDYEMIDRLISLLEVHLRREELHLIKASLPESKL